VLSLVFLLKMEKALAMVCYSSDIQDNLWLSWWDVCRWCSKRINELDFGKNLKGSSRFQCQQSHLTLAVFWWNLIHNSLWISCYRHARVAFLHTKGIMHREFYVETIPDCNMWFWRVSSGTSWDSSPDYTNWNNTVDGTGAVGSPMTILSKLSNINLMSLVWPLPFGNWWLRTITHMVQWIFLRLSKSSWCERTPRKDVQSHLNRQTISSPLKQTQA